MKRMIIAVVLMLPLALNCAAMAEPAVPEQQTEQAEQTEQTEQTEQAEQTEQSEQTEQTEQSELVAPEPPKSALDSTKNALDSTFIPQDEAGHEESEKDDAMTDALNALRKARFEKALEALQAELDEYVAAGKLTQAQADLILENFRQRQENGCDCPWRDGRMDGRAQDGDWMRGNRMGGHKQRGNWQFDWSFGWQFPGGQQRPGDQCPGMGGADAFPGMGE